jgi:hypothetical protein
MTSTDAGGFEPEAVYQIEGLYQDAAPLTIQIAKVGGGQVGRPYTGLWQAVVTHAERELYRGQDLGTALARTHRQAAVALAEFLAAEHEGTDVGDRLTGLIAPVPTPRPPGTEPLCP